MPSDGSSAGSGVRRVRSPEAGSGNRVVTRRFISSPAPLADTDVISNTKREEWTTSKKVVNHKTRQTETRVQRQLVLEDGKVIADTGPQITTRTTEDNKVEESEDTQHKKTGDEDVPDGYVPVPGSERVVCEKTESHQVTKETKEENMKMHDENFKELRGPEEIHRLAVMVPDESPLVGIRPDRFPGKLTHYSSRSRKVTDKDEVKEISEERNGEVTKQTTRTHHHEEKDDDEVPEDEAEGKDLPAVERETKRNFEYLHDGAEIKVPDRMRKQKDLLYLQATSPERHDPVTRRALSLEEEEEIRNSETNRWLDNHFGSETSDDDVVKSKHGGNVINVKMTDTKRTPTPPTKPPRESPNLIYTTPYFKSTTPSPTPLDSTLRSTKSQQKTTSYRREEKVDDSRQSRSSPRSNWKSSPSIYHDVTRHLDESPTRYTKEDRSYRDLESSYRPVEKSTIVGNSVFTREDRRLNESRRVTSEYDRDVKKQPPPERPRSPESRPVQRSQSTRTPEKPVAQTPTYTYSLPARFNQSPRNARGPGVQDQPRGTGRPGSSLTLLPARATSCTACGKLKACPAIITTTTDTITTTLPPPTTDIRSEETEHHRRSGDRNRSPESNISTASRPSKTFYFGDKTDTSYHNSRHKDGYFTIEKDRYVQPPRRFRSDPRERYYSVEDLTTRIVRHDGADVFAQEAKLHRPAALLPGNSAGEPTAEAHKDHQRPLYVAVPSRVAEANIDESPPASSVALRVAQPPLPEPVARSEPSGSSRPSRVQSRSRGSSLRALTAGPTTTGRPRRIRPAPSPVRV
ncbi:LOW QUALITY PROTEIN: uncharacterized protein LOC119390206 [Rhipicephalus sanguineus]|uniref:LOW QUALITY PROTEIN: uncharacterized protein LOC119390206 n=1 Tax=Rhipicephalus sanguineus TaxID=34632 RepID=UPI0020C334B5|nr:LOW QUALITY PROTEIN: uncharacterized protein LOC119390206 [Rhipicephalus sanguineus]